MLKDYFEIKLKRIPYRSPQKNGVVERFHRTLKNEAFDNVIPINLERPQRVCREYRKYYNNYRPHRGILGSIPSGDRPTPKGPIKFICNKHLNGKITSYDPDFKAAA